MTVFSLDVTCGGILTVRFNCSIHSQDGLKWMKTSFGSRLRMLSRMHWQVGMSLYVDQFVLAVIVLCVNEMNSFALSHTDDD